ncbi:hypothetical protein NKDENANG_03402 [Candidatus Entotheonellaceae bacterium PAL068K]
MNKKARNLRNIIDQIDSDMTIFYTVASMEIHPTLGQRFVASDISLPLPLIPMSPFGIVDREEMQLDVLTAKILHRITCRVDRFVVLNEALGNRLEALKVAGEDTLEKRKHATLPTL